MPASDAPLNVLPSTVFAVKASVPATGCVFAGCAVDGGPPGLPVAAAADDATGGAGLGGVDEGETCGPADADSATQTPSAATRLIRLCHRIHKT